jgi:hypothetical protein
MRSINQYSLLDGALILNRSKANNTAVVAQFSLKS